MKISIIIPTFNRKESLALTLQALSRQSFKDFETIVVDDGGTDGTKEFIARFAEATARREKLTSPLRRSYSEARPLRVKYTRQAQKGPASARNLGIKQAGSEIIFFTGDDIIATRDLLEEHSKAHQRGGENLVVLGYTKIWPEIKMTPFRKYLANYHFAYDKIENKTEVDWAYFYTSNISVKKSFLIKSGGFDEDFRWAAYEDTELAWRLHQQGMKMILNKKALAYHNHPMDFWSYRQTMERRGQAAVILVQKVPSLERKASFGQSKNIFERLLKKLIFNDFILSILSAAVCFLDRLFVPLPRFVYVKILDYYRIKGIKKARKNL